MRWFTNVFCQSTQVSGIRGTSKTRCSRERVCCDLAGFLSGCRWFSFTSFRLLSDFGPLSAAVLGSDPAPHYRTNQTSTPPEACISSYWSATRLFSLLLSACGTRQRCFRWLRPSFGENSWNWSRRYWHVVSRGTRLQCRFSWSRSF